MSLIFSLYYINFFLILQQIRKQGRGREGKQWKKIYSINQTQCFTNVREVSANTEHFQPNIDNEHFCYQIINELLRIKLPLL